MTNIISPIPEQPRQSLWDSFVSYTTPPVSPIPYQTKSALGQAAESFTEAKRLQAKQAMEGTLSYLWGIINRFGQKPAVSAQDPLPLPTPSPTPTPISRERMQQAIEAFYRERGNPPIASRSALLAKLITDEPKYASQPGIVAGIPILESSGAQPWDPATKTGITYENNPVNWGIEVTKRGEFYPQSWDEAITKMATGLAYRQKDFTENKGLDTWRNTGDLNALGEWYTPKKSNPVHGGDVYGGRLNDFNQRILELLAQSQ